MFAVNKFADLSPKEFRKTVLMPSRDPPTHPPDRCSTLDRREMRLCNND